MAEMTWHQAIQSVLGEAREALHYAEITDRIIELDLRNSYGATPRNTVVAHLANSAKREGEDSPYMRVGRGIYALKEYLVVRRLNEEQAETSAPEYDEGSSEAGIIHAFGMFWLRESVHWTSAPDLLGRQAGGTVVDFSEQRGVYLLHDGREVIYVGRTVDRSLGKRLYDHTQDRLRSRWDRFSWFGLLGVTEDARLVEITHNATPELMAATLEALLIEGLEPRQNRKRGDGFNAIEYLQADDPEIERVKMQQLLSTMQHKLTQPKS